MISTDAKQTRKTEKLCRIAFLEGAMEGIRLYAIWKNGAQLVGCLQKPLGEVIKPYQEELDRLQYEIRNNL